MVIHNRINFVIIALLLVVCCASNVGGAAATAVGTSPSAGQWNYQSPEFYQQIPPPGRRVLAEDPNGCHCDGTEIHCSNNKEAEQHCECHDHDGTIEVHCKSIDKSCHCDGDVLHCSDGEDLASDLCHCHDGTLECSGQGESHGDHEEDHDGHGLHQEDNHEDPNGCHCDGTDIHCSNNEEAEQLCECHDHDGVIEVHCKSIDDSCHCDGDFLHCSAGEDVASALCHCHDGTLECSGQGEMHSSSHDDDDHDKEDSHSKHDNHGEPHGCHCDGTDIHCSNNEEAEEHCECHDHDGVIEVHCKAIDDSCHCDGEFLHCSAGEDVASALCHCHDGALECSGEGDSHANHNKNNGQEKPWTEVIVSTLLVNLVTLAGLFVVAGQWVQKMFCPDRQLSAQTLTTWRSNIIPMFACGAIMSTTFFLILPEALHLIQAEFGDPHAGHNHRMRMLREKNPEAQATWRWGTSIIGGFLISVLTHACFHDHEGHDHHHHHHTSDHHHHQNPNVSDDVAHDDVIKATPSHTADVDLVEASESEIDVDNFNDADFVDRKVKERKDIEEQPKEQLQKQPLELEKTQITEDISEKGWAAAYERYNMGLLASLTVGDFFHQFADGVFIGTAWLLCSRDLAITISITTVIHCFPHQLADYLMMIHHCNLGVCSAIMINFIAGLGTVLGGIFVLSMNISNAGIGSILAVGGGIFLNVAIAECLPTAQGCQETLNHKIYGLLAFAVGCVPIGLVLLNHEHCGGH